MQNLAGKKIIPRLIRIMPITSTEDAAERPEFFIILSIKSNFCSKFALKANATDDKATKNVTIGKGTMKKWHEYLEKVIEMVQK